MTHNEGTLDRAVRVGLGLGLVLVALVFLWPKTAWAAGAAGLVLLVTGLVGFCPLYRVLGIRTRPVAP